MKISLFDVFKQLLTLHKLTQTSDATSLSVSKKGIYNSERAIGNGALPMSSAVCNIKMSHEILIRYALSSNDGSGEPAQMRRLT